MNVLPARLCLAFAAFLVCALVSFASPPYSIDLDGHVDKTAFPEITFRFRLVDTDGKPVRNLPTQEIIVLEDGEEVFRKPQELRTEAATLLLAIDASGSMLLPPEGPSKIEEAKRAAIRFIEKLDSQTPCGLILFNHRLLHTHSVSTDLDKLSGIVQSISVPPNGGTAMFDAIDHGLQELTKLEDSRKKNLILMTDGMDTASRHRTLTQVINRAAEQNVRVHVIGLGETGPITLDDGEELPADLDEDSLKRLASETGGLYYHVREAEKLSGIFERVAGQLQDSYAVSFRSQRAFHDGTSRGIEIRFGDIAVTQLGYTTHGLITPASNYLVYTGLLVILMALMAGPFVLVRSVGSRAHEGGTH